MHSGFVNLRGQMAMNVRRRMPGRGRTPEVLAEIARIQAMWNDCRARFGAGGPFLFGEFSIADAMYAPVVSRFHTYEVGLEGAAREYAEFDATHCRQCRSGSPGRMRRPKSFPQYEP